MKSFNEHNKESILIESGLRNITKIAKAHKRFNLYFHQDLDGVTSAIAMKAYLEGQGMKMTSTHWIQYGGREYTVPKGDKDAINVLVDFAHGKPSVLIHTDHHDRQVGVVAGTSTSFKHTPSDAQNISMQISPRELFPIKDIKIISMIDSAGFKINGISPDDVMNTIFSVKKGKTLKLNHQEMGLVVNKILLSFKNKPDFLEEIVRRAKPSLISMYTVIMDIAKKKGYDTPEALGLKRVNYITGQAVKEVPNGSIADIVKLKSGGHVMVDYKVLAQYGGGAMMKGGYDRYVPFKLHPTAILYTVAWPMGLLQASMNPFIDNPVKAHLGKEVMGMLEKKWKNKLSKKRVTLDFIKWSFEKDAMKVIKTGQTPIGFQMSDLIALIDRKQIQGLGFDESSWSDLITKITNTPYNKLSMKQKALIKKIDISLWNLIMAGSGGHPAITNISGLNFYGKGYIDEVLHPMQRDVAQVLMDLAKKAKVDK